MSETYRNLVGGEWVAAASGQTFESRNPADRRELVGRFAAGGAEDARAAVAAAAKAFPAWRAMAPGKRAQVLNKAAAYLEQNAAQFACELTQEMGKPLALAQDEIARTAQTLRFYAVEGQTYSGETFPCDDPDMVVYTQREPLGVVAVIAPWNFPASIPARKIAPALITGNTVVFKPSSDAPLTGLRLAEALVAGGLPPGVLNFVTGRASEIGAALTGAPEVKAVTFTGSTAAGEQIHRSVAMTTRTQMELGGKNPLIVMEDADLDAAADLAVKGGLSLTGQACTGTSRVLVMQPVREAFLAKLLARVQALKIGNGLEPGIDLGPLATAKQFETVLSYIEIGKTEGKLLCGGRALTGPAHEHGWFVEPAVFTDVSPQARIAQEEIFGPVLAVITVDSYQQAIAIANDTPYGLSAAIATRNPRYVHEFCRDIQSGTVKVNRTTTGNLTNAPFGGYKASTGSGFRESGRVGLEFFTQTKTVYRAV
ncbi:MULTISPECIES: aldehyde dehydrogenase family protein [Ramlibacter]|uniref:4-(hydroxymethyl)benzenesulfonate dehydrogenase n=1 Tax=Ramlibacter pinisoli TaxID=2682844 RepID=A0A6N8IUF0_9BURK|nr:MULTISPECIES: aldehyde dehydrogenase family protein [Ramlibacter]MBA2965200.1 aldehyde dehydrogenase family protein [Ramlibacter sp. CGMCC 1.13660]MVQ30165.1 aldehyde dehydrogenase family protein [Ramlibacter pinisoli]